MEPAQDQDGRTVIDRHVYAPHFMMLISNAMVAGGSRMFFKLFGFGINEARILSILGHNGPLTQPQMCEVTAMNKSIVSRALQTLLERGLVEPAIASRPQRFGITQAGYAVHDTVVRVSLEREDLLFHGIDADQRALLIELLTRMHDNMGRVNAYVQAVKGD